MYRLIPLVLVCSLAAARGLAQDHVGRMMTGEPDGGARPPAHEDVGQDRGFLQSRAETLGAGRLGIDVYQGVVVGLTYGIADDTQLSVSGTPFVELPVRAASGQLKQVLFRSKRFVAGVRTGVARVDQDGRRDWLVSLGGALDYLPNTIFSVHVSLDLGMDLAGTERRSGLLLQAAMTGRFSTLAQAMAEVVWLGPQGLGRWKDPLLVWGVRLSGKSLCADLGLLRTLTAQPSQEWAMGVPYISVSTAIGGEIKRPGSAELPSRPPFGLDAEPH